MRGFNRAASVVLACAGALAGATATATAAQAPPDALTACTTSQTVQISSLTFQPPAVAAGQSSQAVLGVVNCTGVPQSASAEWFGHYVGSTSGIPANCPAIDPLVTSMNLSPYGQFTGALRYQVPAWCTATGLVVTVRIAQQGVVVAQASAELTIVQPTP